MKQEYRAKLRVNDSEVELNPFIEEFLARTVHGAASSLKHAEEIEDLELSLEHGDISIFANGSEIPLTALRACGQEKTDGHGMQLPSQRQTATSNESEAERSKLPRQRCHAGRCHKSHRRKRLPCVDYVGM